MIESEPLSERDFTNLLEEYSLKRKEDEEVLNKRLEIAHDLYTLEVPDQEESKVVNARIAEFIRGKRMYELLQGILSSSGDLGDEKEFNKVVNKLTDISMTSTTSKDVMIYDTIHDEEAKWEAYKRLVNAKYETGFTAIDLATGGGLARGEMGLVIAPTGRGKSTVAVQLRTNYVTRGMNTLYIALEERPERMLLKMDKNMWRANDKQLLDSNGLVREDVFKAGHIAYENTMGLGESILVTSRPQVMDVVMLEQTIMDIQYRKGIKIDAVIIDYPDLMVNHHLNNLSESDAGGKLYEDIRALCGKHDYICWALAQTNREGFGDGLLTAKVIEGSKKKLNAVELAFTINQTQTEFSEGYLRLHLDKVRYSGAGEFDRTPLFTVSMDGMTIKDATEDEIRYHKTLTEESEQYRGTKHKKDPYVEAESSINDVNAQLNV